MSQGHGRRVLVTGAASGLGAALVRAFAARGDRVLGTDVATRAADDADLMVLDVTSDRDWASARDEVERLWGGLDVLVSNAGIAVGGRLDVATVEEWQRGLDVNLLGTVRGLRAFTPLFKEQRSGHLVTVASLAGLVHPAGMAPYNAAKAALVALTETAGHELEAYGVRATAVCPSYFRSDLVSSMQGTDDTMAAVVSQLVERSAVSADDVATAVLAGVDQGLELILPDAGAQQSWALKQRDRAAYDSLMRAQAAKLAER
jgi:NAD(P)-dependent dehydrogenase (short-subunit alcohol dehydrogenase family)